MTKILILANYSLGLYRFRQELLEGMIRRKYRVSISVPDTEFLQELKEIGCRVLPNKYLERRGMNPLQDLQLIRYYIWLLGKIKPDMVLTYTIKPNIYGGIAAGIKKIPFIANITGLGTAVENGGILQAVTLSLYRLGLRKAQTVFFQNKENLAYMTTRQIVPRNRCRLLPGSGVNLKQHCYEEYPEDSDKLIFSTVGRIMKDKGTDELLEAAENIKKKYPDVTFRVIGFFDEDYQEKIQNAVKKGIIEYIGQQDDIHPFLKESHAVIHPSYHEGMSNVLLEAAATGRPVLASSVAGCRETFDDGISGIGFRPQDPADLIRMIEEFMNLSYDKKVEMGREGRRKMEREFDRQIVVEAYMKEIKKVTGTQKND
nr:glycosyltransferase family 4 protein [uncultured Blautia sp.]